MLSAMYCVHIGQALQLVFTCQFQLDVVVSKGVYADTVSRPSAALGRYWDTLHTTYRITDCTTLQTIC